MAAPSGDIVFIEGEERARFPHSHCLFIDDELPVVIDPATRRDELERLRDARGVRLVVNTHYHVDHTRFDSLFPGAEIAANPLDIPAIESIEGMARAVGLEGVPWRGMWEAVMRQRWGFTERKVARPVPDGTEISLGSNTLRFLHMPGHTAGHTCVQFLEKNAVFLGDIDLGAFGPWYANRSSDIDSFLDSIERIKKLGADTWFTSHGRGRLTGDITGRLDAYAAVISERDERLLEFLSEERTFEQVVAAKIVFRRGWDPPQLFDFFEGMAVGKHLERLRRMGLVASEGGRLRRT